MKVFAVSDLHLSGGVSDKPMDIFGESWQGYMEAVEEDWRARVGEEDVVLLAGDLSWGMHLHEALPDIERVRRLPGIKAIVRGNHDYWWSSIGKVRAALGENFYAVQNDCVRIGRLLVCGSRLWQFGQSDEDMKLLQREKQLHAVKQHKLANRLDSCRQICRLSLKKQHRLPRDSKRIAGTKLQHCHACNRQQATLHGNMPQLVA